MSRFSLGIDIGGTFTDVVVYDHHLYRQYSRKILTTPEEPARAVLDGVDDVLSRFDLDSGTFRRVVHATTLFTNALIERQGARTGLVATRGFGDVLEIGRERKYELYDLAIKKPEPLAPRNLRTEVDERVTADGRVHLPLDEAGLVEAVRRLVDTEGVESLAVVFLHAYRNPAHERRAIEVLRAALPGVALTASHEVAPEIREYERGSTAVVNAYVKPLAARYLDGLVTGLRDRGFESELALMISSGGLTHVEEAKRSPVQMLESGPAAGALAAAFFGSEDAGGRLLAFDMGGTTAKLSLVDDGEPLIAHGFEAARQRRFIEHSGVPVRISTIELIEIGAGGGSIAHRDSLGLVKVGPQSAGSEPGPAAYNRGGAAATVTDADFLLGYLNPGHFAGGTLAVSMSACRAAMSDLAATVGLTVEALAWGIHDIVNENMASAARVHIAERGRDPTGYALACTGGAGPVHAFYLAKKLRIRRILCPPAAGVASALGLLVAPARVDRVATIGFRPDEDGLEALEHAFTAMEADARRVFAEGGLDPSAAELFRFVDGRYVGQGFDLTVALPAGPYDAGDASDVRERLRHAFEGAYREKFQRTPVDVPIEFLNARISARVAIEGASLEPPIPDTSPGGTGETARPAYFQETGGFVETAILDRACLTRGERHQGPAIIEDEGSTLVVGPESTFELLATGNVQIDIHGFEA